VNKQKTRSNWRNKLHEIIYEGDTPKGKFFDIFLFALIIISVILVMLESVKEIDAEYHRVLLACEWFITIFFTIEYIARLVSIKKPMKYVLSFYGIIDLISTIPLYISYFLAGSQVLLAVRALRLLRVFRILKLVQFLGEASQLKNAIKASRTKIAVFIYTVLILSVIMGTVMYWIESDESGFTSIPRGIYWAIVTLTTVGYGDIAPQTPIGQLIATIVMILGYGIIAVPTGIVTAEFTKQDSKADSKNYLNTQACTSCSIEGHRNNAIHCFKCGSKLHE